MPLTLSYFLSSLTRFVFSSLSALVLPHVRLSRACIVFFVSLISSFSSSLLFFRHWFIYFFYFSYLFVFCHYSKVTTISLSRCCLVFCCALFAFLLLSSPLLSVLRHSSSPRLPSRTRLVVF